jgi:ParB family chromosome partitioning protein
MVNKTRVLGKGLGAIIATSPTPAGDIEKIMIEDSSRIIEIDVNRISPNPDQPRHKFDEHDLIGLAESIKSVGLIQPIIVRKYEAGYLVVAGERRLRAVKSLGLATIRSIVIKADEEKNFSLALIENIQRSNLDPIEEAKAYRVLANRFRLKHQDISEKVGKDRSTITNSLRLLSLPEEIQDSISHGKISAGHAKILLSSSSASRQIEIFHEIIEKGLSVRALETLLGEIKTSSKSHKKTSISKKDAHIRKMEEKLVSMLGTKVEIRHSGGKGKIEISYYSLDDFDRIVDIIRK